MKMFCWSSVRLVLTTNHQRIAVPIYIYIYRYQPGNSAGALLGMVKWHFQRLSDLQLGDKKVTLNQLEVVVSLILLFHCLNKCWWTYHMIHMSQVCKSRIKHSLQILYTKSIGPQKRGQECSKTNFQCPDQTRGRNRMYVWCAWWGRDPLVVSIFHCGLALLWPARLEIHGDGAPWDFFSKVLGRY